MKMILYFSNNVSVDISILSSPLSIKQSLQIHSLPG